MKPHNLVNEERARKIIQAYGACPDNWPEEERLAVQKLVQASASLQQLLSEEALFDQRLARAIPPQGENSGQLANRILAGLPEQKTTFINRWRHVLADVVSLKIVVPAIASVLLAVTVVLYSLPGDTMSPDSDPLFEQWVWYDITNQQLANENATADLTFMDLIELESVDAES